MILTGYLIHGINSRYHRYQRYLGGGKSVLTEQAVGRGAEEQGGCTGGPAVRADEGAGPGD